MAAKITKKERKAAKNVSDADRMYCYLWEDLDDDNECKFGERWVFAGQDVMTEVTKRVKASLGVRKDRWNDGKIRIVAVWDVSDLAKKVGRFAKQKRMDDYLREQIGFRKGSTGEIHMFNGDTMAIKVNQLLSKLGQPLITAALSTKQVDVAEEVLGLFEDGNLVVLAELCARFGKTIWSGAVAKEMDKDLIIVASYVKTVFTSFAKDLTSFDQFAEYAHIDTGKEDYQEQFQTAVDEGKKIIAYLSMSNGSKRQERIDYLFSWDNSILIVDEADFGSHTANQADSLIEATAGEMPVIIMTGTNSDRAATHWDIDAMVSVTYPELLIQKRETEAELA